MDDNENIVVNIIEFLSLMALGVIMIVIFMHLLNGTLGAWIDIKFHAQPETIIGTSGSKVTP